MGYDRLIELALGPEVPVSVQSHGHTSRQGEAAIVFGPLDALSYLSYDELLGDLSTPLASAEQAVRFLAAARFRRIEGMRLPSDVEHYGSHAEWFAFSPAGFVLADTTVPEYVRLSVPTEEELELVEQAAFSYIYLQEDRDPFEISSHVKDCDREIWEDSEAQELVARQEIAERRCSACTWERGVWASVLEKTGDAKYGRIARRALNLSVALERAPELISRTTARNWLYAQAARAERDRREGQRMHQARKEGEGK